MNEYSFNRPIIIEGATNGELEYIISSVTSRHDKNLRGYDVIEGFFEGLPLVIGKNKVGTIDAALFTQQLFFYYNPTLLISQGTAGSHLETLHTGDIVIGERVRDTSSFGMTEEALKELEIAAEGEWSIDEIYHSDAELMELALKTPYSHGKVVKGTIGTGDFWTYGTEEIKALSKRFGTTCEEMETFATAKTCAMYDVPFLSVRIISNNEMSGESFEPAAMRYVQEYVLDILRNYGKTIE